MTTTGTRPTSVESTPKVDARAGFSSLSGQMAYEAHVDVAAEGQDSPQAIVQATTSVLPPAGTKTVPPATGTPAPKVRPLEGHKTSHGHLAIENHAPHAVADDIPGGQGSRDIHRRVATGDLGAGRPVAIVPSAPSAAALLADPLLALAADVLSDLEKVRIANENRFRQLTRGEEDSDGETRGFGLDEAHPDVARLGALVGMLTTAEHQATLNLGRLMRAHPLGPWMAARKGIGTKQGARLLAAMGDP